MEKTAVNQAADAGHDDDKADKGQCFPGADNAAEDQDIGEGDGRTGEEECQGGSLSHPGIEQALKDRDLSKGGEIHEGAGNCGEEISPEAVAAHK